MPWGDRGAYRTYSCVLCGTQAPSHQMVREGLGMHCRACYHGTQGNEDKKPDLTKSNQVARDHTGHPWRTFRPTKYITCRRCKTGIGEGQVCLSSGRGEEGRQEVNHVDCWLTWQIKQKEPRPARKPKPVPRTVYDHLLEDP